MDMNDAIRQKIGQIHHMLAGELPPPPPMRRAAVKTAWSPAGTGPG